MSSAVSGNYRELLPSEVAQVADDCADAWKDPSIPQRQYDLVTKGELERFRNRESVVPWDAVLRCWRQIVWAAGYKPSVLDIGAAGGYYSEVLTKDDQRIRYTGVDFSESFAVLADQIYPGIHYELADACDLPFVSRSFDAVISSACIMHIPDYPKAIREAARVSDLYVIFNKTPLAQTTTYFRKEAYGVPCLEIHFNESEFLKLCKDAGLDLIYATECGIDYRSYTFKKYELFHHPV